MKKNELKYYISLQLERNRLQEDVTNGTATPPTHIALKCVGGQLQMIEQYINGIEDPLTRRIFELRTFERMTFEQIGTILYLDKSTICKRYHNYLKTRR